MTEDEIRAFRGEIRSFLAREFTLDLKAIAELNFSQSRKDNSRWHHKLFKSWMDSTIMAKRVWRYGLESATATHFLGRIDASGHSHANAIWLRGDWSYSLYLWY